METKIIKCCETCRYGLGGGFDNCRINLESECGDGEHEAWEPKDIKLDIDKMASLLASAIASTGISAEQFKNSMVKVKKAMQNVRSMERPRYPRKVQMYIARSMLKKRERSRIWRDEP